MKKKKAKGDLFLIIMTAAMFLLLAIWIIKDLKPSKIEETAPITEAYSVNDFKKTDLKEILNLIKGDNLTFVYIGYEGCDACDKFVPKLAKVTQNYDMEVYYLDIKSVDKKSQEWKTFTNKLSKKVSIATKSDEETSSETKTIGKFLYENGYTPTFVVLKSNKFINGNIGGMDVEKLHSFLNDAGYEKNS